MLSLVGPPGSGLARGLHSSVGDARLRVSPGSPLVGRRPLPGGPGRSGFCWVGLPAAVALLGNCGLVVSSGSTGPSHHMLPSRGIPRRCRVFGEGVGPLWLRVECVSPRSLPLPGTRSVKGLLY